jgi:tetratricopeptide (TPR) repeat protein
VADLSKSIDLKAEGSDVWLWRGEAYIRLGQWEKAVGDFSQAIALKSTNPWAWYGRGWTYAELEQWDRAVADFTRSLELGGASEWFAVAHVHALALAAAGDRKGSSCRSSPNDSWDRRDALRHVVFPAVDQDADPVGPHALGRVGRSSFASSSVFWHRGSVRPKGATLSRSHCPPCWRRPLSA